MLFEPLTGLYATHERALARLDRILGEMRRKRIREPDGWYFIYGPDGVQDVVGTGKEKGKEMPKFSASVR